MCNKCEKKSRPKTNTKPKNLEKRQKKKVKKMVEEKQTTQTVYLAGSPKVVLADAKKLRTKQKKLELRRNRQLLREKKLQLKIQKLEKSKERLETRTTKVNAMLKDADFLGDKLLKGKKVVSIGVSMEGRSMAKIGGKWFIASPINLVGEKPKLIEVAKFKEQKLTRRIRRKITENEIA